MWRLWHNVQHHVHTQHPHKDPDTSATYADYQRRPALQWLYRLVRRNGFLFFPMLNVWFTIHSSQMFWRLQRLANGPTRLMLWGERTIPFVAWISLAFWLGIGNFVWAYVLPLLIGNFIAMSYIATNHLLNPKWTRQTLWGWTPTTLNRWGDGSRATLTVAAELRTLPLSPDKAQTGFASREFAFQPRAEEVRGFVASKVAPLQHFAQLP